MYLSKVDLPLQPCVAEIFFALPLRIQVSCWVFLCSFSLLTRFFFCFSLRSWWVFFLCFLGFSLLFSPYPSFYGFYVFMELQSLKLKFHMDTFSTLVLPVHGTQVSKTRFATVNSSLRDLRCQIAKQFGNVANC